ncbi:MAG: aconitase X swivel domain-containing protein [Candidatus Njordarchaeia archaeon]
MKERLICQAKIINPWDGTIRGDVVKTEKKISFLGDVNPENGEMIAPDSDIKGVKITNKILVFPSGRGSTVGAGVLFGLAKRGVGPKMIITVEPEQVVVSGAIFANIPMVSEIPLDFFNEIKTSDTLEAETLDKKTAILKVY